MPRTADQIEIHASFRFSVKVNDQDLAAFTECNLPSLQVETQDIVEGGQNEYIHKLPVRVKPGSLTLKRGITKNDDLLKWYLQVLEGKMREATRTVTVVMYDSLLRPINTWTFRQAYPIKWSGPQLKSGDKAVAIEELEIAHHGFEIG
jgi:phage tail-like protein